MKIRIKRLRDNVELPAYQTECAAAMDVQAAIDTPTVIQPMERQLIPTGFAMELPQGYEAQLRARSGLSLNHGICLANGVATIDADYRGEVGVILINLGSDAFTIEPGMRIAQMVIAKHEIVRWDETAILSDSKRGEGGFGSTAH
ncbi:MAG: dUTP diphosphatase [Candidatus Saccharimonadales bacterium]